MINPDPGRFTSAGKEADVEFRDIRKVYGTKEVLSGVSISVNRGELLTLLGPSGCGKTTLLRILAGFVRHSAGEVWVGGKRIDDIPPAKRNVGMVFQNYSLFPHMTVYDNVAFGLRMRRMDKSTINRRVHESLELVRLTDSINFYPSQLSGGMQQRIALSRVIAIQPRVLLLDEPFGAIDRQLRDEMQIEVRKIQKQLGITTLFVTHDQQEALTISDRIVVMNYGRVEQEGMPVAIYDCPKSRFVAEFLGMPNLLPVHLMDVSGNVATVALTDTLKISVPADKTQFNKEVTLAFRAENVHLSPAGEKPAPGLPDAGDNVDKADKTAAQTLTTPATVMFVTNLGSRVTYEIQLDAGPILVAEVQRSNSALPYSVGDKLMVTLEGDQCVLL